MSILWGSFETFLVFLCISVELQHRDKTPQLGLIAVYFGRTCSNGPLVWTFNPWWQFPMLISLSIIFPNLHWFLLIWLFFCLLYKQLAKISSSIACKTSACPFYRQQFFQESLRVHYIIFLTTTNLHFKNH